MGRGSAGRISRHSPSPRWGKPISGLPRGCGTFRVPLVRKPKFPCGSNPLTGLGLSTAGARRNPCFRAFRGVTPRIGARKPAHAFGRYRATAPMAKPQNAPMASAEAWRGLGLESRLWGGKVARGGRSLLAGVDRRARPEKRGPARPPPVAVGWKRLAVNVKA